MKVFFDYPARFENFQHQDTQFLLCDLNRQHSQFSKPVMYENMATKFILITHSRILAMKDHFARNAGILMLAGLRLRFF